MGPTLLLVLTALLGFSSATSPDFCRGKPCPTFTVLQETSDYVIRSYNPSVWVEIHRRPGENRRVIFGKLQSYFKSNGLTMNVPIVGHLSLSGTEDDVVRVYLGQCTPDFQPPEPTDPRLHIHHDPALTYYVAPLKPVAGNANYWKNEEVWKTQARELIGKLPTQGQTDFSAAHYGPKKNMYGEIWVHTTGGHAEHHGHNHGQGHGHNH